MASNGLIDQISFNTIHSFQISPKANSSPNYQGLADNDYTHLSQNAADISYYWSPSIGSKGSK